MSHSSHWTPPESVEMSVQQSGSGGKDGEKTVAVMYHNEGDLTNDVTEEMAAYCVNRDRKCRQFLLMSEFDCYNPADMNMTVVMCVLRLVGASFVNSAPPWK